MTAPPYGLCLPVRLSGEAAIYDGDTLKLKPTWSELEFTLRLLDCWCPEIEMRGKARDYTVQRQAKIKQAGVAARDELQRVLSDASRLSFAIPFTIFSDLKMSQMLTFGRVLGHLWADDINVAAHLVEKGLAFRTKTECMQAGLA